LTVIRIINNNDKVIYTAQIRQGRKCSFNRQRKGFSLSLNMSSDMSVNVS